MGEIVLKYTAAPPRPPPQVPDSAGLMWYLSVSVPSMLPGDAGAAVLGSHSEREWCTRLRRVWGACLEDREGRHRDVSREGVCPSETCGHCDP